MSQDAFEREYGFRLPASVRALDEILGRPEHRDDLYELLSYEPYVGERAAQVKELAGYAYWRPEFYPLMRPGVDGVEMCVMALAPELQQNEYPIVEWAPLGGELYYYGDNASEAIVNIVASLDQAERERYADSALAHDLQKALGVPTVIDAKQPNGGVCESLFVPPMPPQGYTHYAPDGDAGVLAPNDAFNVDFPFPVKYRDESLLLADAEKQNAAGFPATAMALLYRDPVQRSGTETSYVWTALLAACYTALGRERYAQRTWEFYEAGLEQAQRRNESSAGYSSVSVATNFVRSSSDDVTL